MSLARPFAWRHILAHILYAFSGLLIVASQVLPVLPAFAVSGGGSLEVTALVPGPPPAIPAVIEGISSNTSVTVTPMVVSGTCGPGLTVRLYDNGTEIGHAECSPQGRFIINIILMLGRNDLTVLNFDVANQAGPTSDTITIFVVPLAEGSTQVNGTYIKPGSVSSPGGVGDSGPAGGGGGSITPGEIPTPRPSIQSYFDRILPLGGEWVLLGGVVLGGLLYGIFVLLKHRTPNGTSGR